MAKKQICFLISFGHGAYTSKNLVDPGAVSNGMVEAELTKKVAIATYKYLLGVKGRNYKVSFPEKDGVGDHLFEHNEQARVLAKKYRVVSIDIHFNAFAKNYVNGVEAIVQNDVGKKKCSTNLGNFILKELVKLGFNNRGIKKDNNFTFLKNKGIANIIECGFITSNKDRKLMDTNKELRAIGIAIGKGLVKYNERYK